MTFCIRKREKIPPIAPFVTLNLKFVYIFIDFNMVNPVCNQTKKQ